MTPADPGSESGPAGSAEESAAPGSVRGRSGSGDLRCESRRTYHTPVKGGGLAAREPVVERVDAKRTASCSAARPPEPSARLPLLTDDRQ